MCTVQRQLRSHCQNSSLFNVKYFTVRGCSSEVGGAAAAVVEYETYEATAPRVPSRSRHVLMEEVLQMQRNTIGTVKEVAKEVLLVIK